jgi:hypothetical protein
MVCILHKAACSFFITFQPPDTLLIAEQTCNEILPTTILYCGENKGAHRFQNQMVESEKL